MAGRARRAAAVAATLVGVAACFARLRVETWYVDEVAYVRAGAAYARGDFAPNGEHPPLAKLLFGLGERAFGGPYGARVVAALCGALLVVTVAAFAERSYRGGAVAVVAWLAIPRSARLAGATLIAGPLERHAMLDVVATALATLGLAAGWRWARGGRWRDAVLAGACAGLAAAAKLPGGLYLPGVLLVAVATRGEVRRRAAQAGAAGAAAVAAWAAAFLPMGGGAPAAMREVFARQLGHATDGHPMVYAGRVLPRAPWWGQAWIEWDHDGPLLVAVLAAAAVAAFAWGDRRLAALLALAFAGPFVALSASPVALPHYRYVWLPPLALLAGLGVVSAARARPAPRTVALAACGVLAAGAVANTGNALRLRTGDYRAASAYVGADRRVYLDGYLGTARAELAGARYVPLRRFLAGAAVDAVVLDRATTSRHDMRAVRAELRRRRWGCHVTVDRLDVWLAPGRCVSAASASATPAGRRPSWPAT
ncbi:MAG TPA: glycosyltransferase family 39 protein [Mycobacteriales bacterium]|jgi:4-amino-4-deoxy-L-arabinose transferase-like glycosyltransferase|nr:glycosyltransferase family 39 protein [Mycobacteriales bacterium]